MRVKYKLQNYTNYTKTTNETLFVKDGNLKVDICVAVTATIRSRLISAHCSLLYAN